MGVGVAISPALTSLALAAASVLIALDACLLSSFNASIACCLYSANESSWPFLRESLKPANACLRLVQDFSIC